MIARPETIAKAIQALESAAAPDGEKRAGRVWTIETRRNLMALRSLLSEAAQEELTKGARV